MLDCRAVNIRDDVGFLNFCSQISKYGYKPATRKTLHEIQLAMDAEEIKALSDNFEEVTAINLTADGWSSDAKDAYCGLTAHWIDQNWILHSKCLGCNLMEERHTAELLVPVFNGILDKVGANRCIVNSFTRDNGANFVSAINLFLQEKNQGGVAVPCVDYTLQLSVLDAIKANSDVKALLASLKAVVAHFHKSDLQTRLLSEAAETLGRGVILALIFSFECLMFAILIFIIFIYRSKNVQINV